MSLSFLRKSMSTAPQKQFEHYQKRPGTIHDRDLNTSDFNDGSFVVVREIHKLPKHIAPKLQAKYPGHTFLLKEYKEDSLNGENASYLFGSEEPYLTLQQKASLLIERQELLHQHFQIVLPDLVVRSEIGISNLGDTILEIQPKIEGVGYVDFIKRMDLQEAYCPTSADLKYVLEQLDLVHKQASQSLVQFQLQELASNAYADLSGRDNLMITPDLKVKLIDTNVLCSAALDRLTKDRSYKNTMTNLEQLGTWLECTKFNLGIQYVFSPYQFNVD